MRLLNIIGISVLIIGLSSLAFAEELKRVARVIDVEGSVKAKLAGEKAWVPVKTGMVLNEGDYIKTKGGSSAVLNLDGGGETATVNINENTQMMLAELLKDEEGHQMTLLDVAIGKILIKAKKLHSEEERFEVKTPSTIVGVRGTTFAVDVETLE